MLLDTSGLMCLFDRDERRYGDAKMFFDVASFRISHNYVLAEFVALANARGVPRKLALNFVSNLQDVPLVEVVYVEESLHREALTFLQEHLYKTYSLCDAVSFLLMRQLGIKEALTTDFILNKLNLFNS